MYIRICKNVLVLVGNFTLGKGMVINFILNYTHLFRWQTIFLDMLMLGFNVVKQGGFVPKLPGC